MDYKYIEQLLERYWQCQTTLEEEAILRSFFRQEDVPASLLPYRQIFEAEEKLAAERLSQECTDRMLRLAGEDGSTRVCRARRLTFAHRLRPFYRAAGLVALLLTIGNAARQSVTTEEETPQQMAETIAADTVQNVTIGSPTHQSAALSAQPQDSLAAVAR